ncbi:SCO-spondin [Anguilla rostrata]|uniref:SCO-spondin n=1 Tax=Anguilla rostrata TaxID=7938 RepID=UPI0030CDDDD8
MDCPPGRYCTEFGGVQLCPEGHYCPGGTGEDVLPCPPGTYSPQPGQSHLEQCLLCPAGMYCEDWSLSGPTGPCQSGYFCLAGINFQNPDGNISTGVGGPCPKGHYCPAGTSLPLPCPPGSFSNRLHVTERAGCTPCPPGQFCGSAGLAWPSGPCREGRYCPGGDSAPTGPEAGGGVCPVAHYCSPGSAAPIPCPAGNYTNLMGQALCSRCHAGYYCPERISNYTRFPCPAGFYCPDGTRHATQYPCPRGYYNPEPMTQSLDSCLPCPPGHYCEKERLTIVSGKCRAGWFCVSAAWNFQPFDLDNYTNANCLCPATSTGGRCQEGYYCPAGSSEPLPCPPGAFCNATGLAQPVGPCSPGYYCSGGATRPRPTDAVTGNICPPGTYCGNASGEPRLCPAGSFSAVAGISSEAQCQRCTAGSYCSAPGLRAPTGPCSEGYWCPPGQTVGVAEPCPGGHYCPTGSPAPIPCPAGMYQDREKQPVCLACKPGYYCDQHFGAVNGTGPRPCPRGHYCPPGTGTAAQFGCPMGTFNPREGGISLEDCMMCPPGKFCPAAGLSEPGGDCHAGFWCKEGARSPTPTEGDTGVPCPAGYYCPTGTVAPVPCPLGTWWNSKGCKSPEECQPCPSGFYCDTPGLSTPSGPCSAGFYCTERAVTPTPSDNRTGGRCPEQHYCPVGTSQPVLCEPGTFITVTQATACWPCPPGRYCMNGTIQLCPAGFYCPEGSGYDWRACPEGTYGADAGLTAISECRECDPGHYCGQRNATAVTGPCQEGYYCPGGNASPQPHSDSAGEGGPCPAGHYCPRGAAEPQPCPEGTFSNLTRLVSKDDCTPCSPGHYCRSAGLTSPSGECWEGFFCHRGAVLPNSPIRDGRGGPCPPGYFCPKGVAAPQVCPEGSFSTVEGQASCSRCPRGYYCPGNGSSYQGHECATGHYCPVGSTSKYQQPCPAGTFNPHTRKGHLEDCLPCPPGFFCGTPGLSAASGPCIAGHFCVARAATPSPEDGKTGDKCPRGHYCLEGSSSPKQCPVGHYSNTSGNTELSHCLPCPAGFSCASPGLSAPSGLCQAGYYCPLRQNSSNPTSYTCSPGHRCPPGSATQSPCAPGTYQDRPGQADCAPCPAGHFCTGSSHPETGHTPSPCPKGHYCPPGAKSGVEFPCPVGTFSDRTGVSRAEQCAPCPPGKYCGSAGLSAPTGQCSAGYLCILGAVVPQPAGDASGGRCSSGTYCPQGSVSMLPCPPGTYNPLEGAASVDACLPCPRGQYCAGIGLDAPSGSCSPGHYCSLGSSSAEPQELSTASTAHESNLSDEAFPAPGENGGGVCPRGHYCPAGGAQPLPCPPGTFLSKYGAQSEAECQPCPAAFYCPEWGQRSAGLECPEGWFCPVGSSLGQLPEHRCPEGHACPSGSAKPAVCPPGTHQPLPAQSTCSPCPPAFYCQGGVSAPVPCPGGTVGQTEGLHSQQLCAPCPAGSYCNGSALTTPTGPCSAGHYCTLGAVEPAPLSQAYGDSCPPGHYCPQGSSSPVPCPMGTYLPNKGAPFSSFCTPCPPGHYCDSLGAPHLSGLCSPGHYCTEGAETATPQATSSDLGCSCDVILKAANDMHSLCSWGRNTTCHTPEGSEKMGRNIQALSHPANLQNDTDITCASFKGDICPQGFYCPEGSSAPKSCDQGLYCNQTGLASPSGPCEAGFYCPRGSTHPQTSPCPPGNYCPLGTPYPLPCPPGTLQSAPGGSALEDCPPCPPGHYCSHSGLVVPSGPCAAGHYCPAGQATSRPPEHACAAGHFCPQGSARETACSPGSYQPREGQEACAVCPAGSVCPKEEMIHPMPCQAGFYCPMGTASQLLCPPGSYGNHSGLTEASECTPCDPGMYCKGSGNTSPTGPCSAGFLCFGGSPLPSPTDEVTGAQCPPGFYCPAGSFSPRSCPKGTFSEQSGLAEPSQCRPCSPGHYCSEPGLSAVSGPCLPGYFCLEGSQSAAPDRSAFGGVCSPGHYCESGTASPAPCPAGTHRPDNGGRRIEDCMACPAGWFQGQEGQMECTPCPPGFHCPPPSQGSSAASAPLPCPAGYFCPRETPPAGPAPCPKGTFSSALGLSAAGQCLPCPEGYFCGSEGLVEPTGRCRPGFLCFGGAQVPNPTDHQTGSPCPRGAFCQQGVIVSLCSEGYYCAWGSSSPEPDLCPTGYYCPTGTDAPAPCPPGTFSPRRGNAGQDDCVACPAGHFCQGEGVVQPEPCPSGHYCPPGAAVGTEFPCPPGTMRPQRGGAGPEDCQLCPAGMFCALHGLVQPTGPCQAGFHCPPGASSPNSTGYMVRSAANGLCPPGHYCPAGEGYPLPCPPGSYSSSVGLRRAEQCQACPAGHYCDRPALTHVSQAALCDAGYVCLGGSLSPRPSDGLQGYLCPRGFRCPIGTPMRVPCEPGSYGPTPGATLCTPCPAGTVCPSPATQEPSTCPAGHYCEGGTALAQACPAGTLSELTGAQSPSTCVPCPAGQYCSTPGSSQPQGQCRAGYFCQGGATDPAPQGSPSFPRNGPCPLGHYCPAGTPSPLPCPTGSVLNHTGGHSIESCLPCPPGQYCASEGQGYPSGPCSDGFYCPPNFSSASPLGFLCPKGHYCPLGSGHALPCPTGEYQPNPGASGCIPCRPGFYCEETIAGDPWPCPAHSYCPAATMVPLPCPNGTFTPPDLRGLQEEGECLPCPPGRFCRAGKVLGCCAAGYLCFSGSAEATPQGPPLQDRSQCRRGVQCAGPCPAGFYCVEGTEEPQACPAHTVRAMPGATGRQDCLPCPPQHWCREGDPSLHLCPAGHYCDGLGEGEGESEGGVGPKECPPFTYRSTPGARNRGDCHPCPAGSFCNDTGLTDYSAHPCPPGFWCSGVGPPVLCPAGTMRPLPGAGSPSQCMPCQAGTYCPDPRSTGRPNIHGTPCRSAFQCPAGSVMETPCLAGSYCGPGTGEPTPCPGGFACPEGSAAYNTPQQVCAFPHYCPENSSSARLCDGGYAPLNTSGLRGSRDTSCVLCEGGTYRPGSSPDPHCLTCPAGYHCPPGTERYWSNPCPVGYFCPLGSDNPTSCPPGSYGNSTHAKLLEECHPCPAGTFNHLSAQRACFPCGSSSYSPEGSASCICLGQNRAFQHSDGSCLCKTGFVFYNQLDYKSTDADSVLDCQPEVNERCGGGQVRLASSRECVSTSAHLCNVTCGTLGGHLNVELGICHCELYVAVEELCNASCLSSLPHVSARLASDGQLLLKVKGQGESSMWSREVVDILGPDIHVKTIGRVHFVQFGSDGVFGWIMTNQTLIDRFLSAEPRTPWDRETRRRSDSSNVGEFSDSPPVPRIPNPIACLASNDMLLFQLTINHADRHLSHFPVYQKDHLFSSNPSWDFGAFRKLEQLIKHSQYNSSRFAHVFTQSGKYVFLDNGVPDRSLIVAVSERGTECDPAAPAFQPASPAQLVRHGILRQPRLNLLPNWGAIAGVLGLLVLLTVVLIATALVLKPSRVGLIDQGRPKPKWRSLGEPSIPPGYVYAGGGVDVCDVLGHRGVGEGAEAEEPAVCRGYKNGRVELEEFNVKTLYDKLEDQTLHLVSQLAKHRKDNLEFYRNICQQTDSVKDLLENMDQAKLSQLRELLSLKSGDDITAEKETVKDPSASLLEAALRAVEGLIHRAEGESWAQQDVAAETCPGDVGDGGAHTGYAHGFPDSTQLSSPDMAEPKTLQVTATATQQSAAGGLSEQDLSKLVALTPLSKTLREIQHSLQSLPSAEEDKAVFHESEQESVGHLVPVALGNLPPHHFAVFLFGCRVARLLCGGHGFPPLTLLLARAVPLSRLTGLAEHCRGDFYYDAANRILYLHQDKLGNAGEFIATLLHSMACIASGSTTKGFIQAFHSAVSALSLVLFHSSFTSRINKTGEIKEEFTGALAEEFLSVKVPIEMGFSEPELAERLQKFKFFKLQQYLREMKSNQTQEKVAEPGSENGDAAIKVLSVEQEIDRLNEVFLQLSVGLQGRAERRGGQDYSGPTQGTLEPCLSRHGTLLLDLKRRCVDQRLSEMQAQLTQLSMQQPGSQKPDSQEPASQEPGSQAPESQNRDNQTPDNQGPDSELAESQKQNNHDPETQMSENIHPSFSQDPDKLKSPTQTFHIQKPDNHKTDSAGPNRQTSEVLITEESSLPAVF